MAGACRPALLPLKPGLARRATRFEPPAVLGTKGNGPHLTRDAGR